MNLDYRGFSNVGRIVDKCYISVRCDNCGYVKLSFISEKDAIKEWNKGEM